MFLSRTKRFGFTWNIPGDILGFPWISQEILIDTWNERYHEIPIDTPTFQVSHSRMICAICAMESGCPSFAQTEYGCGHHVSNSNSKNVSFQGEKVSFATSCPCPWRVGGQERSKLCKEQGLLRKKNTPLRVGKFPYFPTRETVRLLEK